jgi:hypothetical protein
MHENWKLIGVGIIAVAALVLLGAGLIHFGNWSGFSREKMRTQDYQKELAAEQEKREAAQKETAALTAEVAKLRAQMKDGLSLVEERKALDTREADLKRREEILQAESTAFYRQKEDFFTRVKTTEQEYGSALHALSEYDAMRAEKDRALRFNETGIWVFFVSLVSATGVVVFLAVRLLKHRHRLETQREAARFVETLLGSSVNPEETKEIVRAFGQAVGLPSPMDR